MEKFIRELESKKKKEKKKILYLSNTKYETRNSVDWFNSRSKIVEYRTSEQKDGSIENVPTKVQRDKSRKVSQEAKKFRIVRK